MLLLAGLVSLYAQERRDRAVLVDSKNEFLDSIKAELKKSQPVEEKKKSLRLDFSGIAAPASVGEFTSQWHMPPISQGLSGMCWCFSATSFFESEIHRLTKRDIKLSELYTVYWEYVEKARGYVRTRGKSTFGQGSQMNAVIRIWKQYGALPASAYTGLKDGRKIHDHDTMFQEMNAYLKSIAASNSWDEEAAASTVRSILDHYLGAPPTSVVVEGKSMSPKEYLDNVVRLPLGDYVGFVSSMEQPSFTTMEYEVPDNWWHSKDYHNVPLDDFMAIVRESIRKGYTLVLWGDTSEPGYEGHAGIGVVPTFDIPSAYIDSNARQFRFSNNTTSDDHGIHLVGYTVSGGSDWYLIKDSGSSSRNNSHPGYYFYHPDYVKLKILGVAVHKDAVRDLLSKFTK